jgi:peptide/nickel transport system substrate-binding protein
MRTVFMSGRGCNAPFIVHGAGVIWAFAAACGAMSPSVTAAAAAGDELRVAINSDIRGLEPGVNRDDNTDSVIHHVVESLVAYRADLSIAPHVAASWSVSDEGRTYTFRLRQGITFHNGAPVTSAEVQWSWNRYLRPGSAWVCRNWFDGSTGRDEGGVKVLSIDAPDPATVVFRLDRASGLFLPQLASVQCPGAILHPDSVDRNGDWVKPVATGPYRLSEWRRGEHVELQRFAGYVPRKEARSGYAGARIAGFERLRFVIVPEAVSALAALRAGSIDVIPNVAADALPGLERMPNVRIHDQALLNWTVLLVNSDDPVLRDVRVRRALGHAIGRNEIVQANTGGRSRVNSSAVPVASEHHTSLHDIWFAYDPNRARELLRTAGYRGEPVRIQTNRRYKNMFDNAVVIQAMLQAAGMNAQLEVMDWATQLAYYQAGKFQLASFSYSVLTEPALRYAKLIGNKSERSSVQWDDPLAQKLLGDLLSHSTDDARTRTMEQLHRRMVERVPIIGLYNGDSALVTRAELRGISAWPAGTLVLWGVSKDSDQSVASAGEH